MTNHVGFVRAGFGALTLLFFSSFAFGQSDLGSISGYVKDPSGATIPGAKITIHNQSGLDRQAVTNDSGFFTITNIPASTYSALIEAKGFKKYESNDNKLDPSTNLELDATLTVGSETETIEVSSTAQVLQTESAAVQSNITRQQIDALELNGRNPIFMANLVPGTRGGNLSGLSFGLSQGPSNINGARTPESLITYDGAPAVRTRSNGTSIGSADVDSTSEIQVLTADYAAEYGRSSGGQIRVITKSGSQTFHGAAFEYLRNTDLNANTWTRNLNAVTNFTPPVHYNQFGYNIGGPFYIPGKFNRDKSRFFWYFGQEWVRYVFTDNSNLTVPSLAMRGGDFSELLNPKNPFTGKAVVISNPATGVPYVNNVIPTSQLNPSGLGILKAYPAPNLATPINGSNNWSFYAKHPQNQRKDTLAVDMNLSQNQRLTFRRNNYTFFEYVPLDGGTNETPRYFNRPNQTNALNYIWTITPHLVNEALATVSLDDVYIPVDGANFLDRTKVGIVYPYIFPNGKLISTRIPTANIQNLSGLNGGPYPSHSAGPIYTVSDSLTWVRGNHTFKFGGNYERSGENDNDEINVSACPTCTNNQNGQFSFTDGRSGNPTSGSAIANVALGLFDTYSELGERAYTPFRGSMSEGFAQDNWKVSQKLNIYYGLRYSVIVPYAALWRNEAVFDPAFYDPTKAVKVDPKTGNVVAGSGDIYNGLVIPGTKFPDSAIGRFSQSTNPALTYLFRGGTTNAHYSDIQWNDFQPRVGLAYQIDPKTVLRAGGGRFVTRLGVSDSIFLGGNPPFQPTASLSFGNIADIGSVASTNTPPLTATTQSKAFRNPEAWNWNFTVQRELPFKSVMSVAYVGRRGLHLQRESDINQPTVATVLANPGVNLDALRPYKGYNSIRETDNVANSRYNSLQLSWNTRGVRGVTFGVAYTYSHSNDDGSNQRDIIPDTYNAHNLWGPSEFDAHHVFIANYLYELPFFRSGSNLTGRLLGGWQVSGIVQFQTGTPCGIGAGTDYAGVGQDGSFGCGNAGQFWVINGTPSIVGNFAKGGSSDPTYYFQTTNSDGSAIFTAPAKGTFNLQNGVRGTIFQPGFENWNLGLFKKFAINERTGFQFRAEAFNVLNHPNWSGAGLNPTNLSTFGKVTGKTNDVRNLQVSLRYYF